MACTREQAFQTLAALKPAPAFLESYRTKRLPENLDIYFGPPEEFFLAPDSQDPYTRGRLVPILDDGNFGIVTFYDPDAQCLVQIDIESPDEILATFRGWQQYLADLMIRIGESVEDDERVRRMAELLQFRHIDELFTYWQRAAELTSREYHAAKEQFVQSIPAA